MERFEIKNRFSGETQLTAEIECGEETPVAVKLRLAVRWALKTGADLSGADLEGANLEGADLRGADLRGAYLRGADLRGAYLRGAYLEGANLSGAYLRGADLRGADLRGADLQDARLEAAVNVKAVLQLGPLGSRSDYLIAFNTSTGVKIKAGCFYGNVDAFLTAVDETHQNNRHGRAYRAAIAFVQSVFAEEVAS